MSNKRLYQQQVEQFSALLNVMVDRTYCMGGTDQAERYLATADFLMTLAHRMLSRVEGSPEIPPLR